MKKVLIVLCLVLAAGIVYSAAPAANGVYNSQTSVAVTAQHTATSWDEIDSAIVLETDTCFAYFFVQGTVVLQPEQAFYIAFRDSPDGTRVNEKSFTLPEGADGPMTISFGNFYVDSLISQTDKTDSIFVDCAVKGTGVGEGVTILTWNYSGNVVDISR